MVVHQQNQIDVAGGKAIHQTRQQLQLKLLYGLGVGEDHEALGGGFVALVYRLVNREFGEYFVKAVDQFFRVGRGPQLHMLLALLFEMLKDAPAVIGERHLVVAQNG